MPIRDIFVTIPLLATVPYALRHPYVGILAWIIVSVMNPHRLTWGFAYSFPFAAVIGGATLVGLVTTKDPRRFPVNGVTISLLLFTLWLCVTTPLAFYPDLSLPLLVRALKILLMVFVAMVVINSHRQVDWMIMALVASLGLYGVKGGIFTLLTGGAHRVYGPAGSFIEDNNALALALIMSVPLIYYVATQSPKRWMRLALYAAMGFTALAALGSQSRGALLALVAMGGFLWLRSHNKLWLGLALLALAPLMFAFMPESWVERMRTIQTYEQDLSAQGRINAWWMAFNAAKDRITGLGFATASNELFAIYAPNPDLYLAAHSIYFQVLGEHGFPGLFLFLMVWFTTWLCANWIRRHSRSVAELQWAFVLASMIQVSMVAYLVGGTFLSLSYFDLPYYELAAVVIVREIIRERERGLYAQQAKEAATRDRAPAAASPGGSGQPAPQ